jgi:hypothetical protein
MRLALFLGCVDVEPDLMKGSTYKEHLVALTGQFLSLDRLTTALDTWSWTERLS